MRFENYWTSIKTEFNLVEYQTTNDKSVIIFTHLKDVEWTVFASSNSSI